MILDIYQEVERGRKIKIDERLETDPSITYQQYALYYMLRSKSSTAKEGDTFDVDQSFAHLKKNGWVDKTYPKTAGGKVHRMEVTVPWDHVFDK